MHNLIFKIASVCRPFRKKEDVEEDILHIYLKNTQLSLLATTTVLDAEITLVKGDERITITSLPVVCAPIKHFVRLVIQSKEKSLQDGVWNVEKITIREDNEVMYQYDLCKPVSISRDKQMNYTWIMDNDWGGIGDGSARLPYEVSSPLQLDKVRNYINKKEVCFRQMCDIQLADALKTRYSKTEGQFIPNEEGYIGDENGWIPIGSFESMRDNSSFQGHYDGRGFKIDGLFINRPDSDVLGLFGIVEGKSMHSPVHLSNIHIGSNSAIVGQTYVGAIAGNTGYTKLCNCRNAGMIRGIKCVGGIVGATLNSIIQECENHGVVKGDKDFDELVGRLVQASKKSY